jgi:hypothetical protein
MSLLLAEKENPEETIALSDEQIASLRQTLLSECEKRGVEVSTLSRRDPLFIEAAAAVKTLDAAGFDWGRELDDEQKYWVVTWASRVWRGMRKRYTNQRPAYVEVF